MTRALLPAFLLLLTAGSPYKVKPEKEVPSLPGGTIIFRSERDGNPEIYAMRPDGTGPERLTWNTRADERPVVSPNGQRIVYRSWQNGDFDLIVLDLLTRESFVVTDTDTEVGEPGWSPDSEWIVYTADLGQEGELWMVRADGSERVRVTRNVSGDTDASFSPDGGRILYESYRLRQNYLPSGETLTFSNLASRDLYEVDVACLRSLDGALQDAWDELPPEDQKVVASPERTCERRLTDDVDSNVLPSYSPDGRWIAYVSNRTGRRGELMLMDAMPAADGSRRMGRVLDDFSLDMWNDFFERGHNGPAGDHPFGQLGVTRYRWSPDGTQMLIEGTLFKSNDFWSTDTWLGEVVALYDVPSGVLRPVRVNNTFGVDHSPRFSPDGDWVVFAAQIGSFRNEIFVRHLESGAEHRLTENRVGDFEPYWTEIPDPV